MTMSPPMESAIQTYVPGVGEPPLTVNEGFNFNMPQQFLSNLRAFANPDEATEVKHRPARPVVPDAIVFGAAQTAIADKEHILIRGNDQLDAIDKHLDAVPLNKVRSGDLVVLSGRPGRREQWGIVTEGKDGQLSVHHTDSHYWSKTNFAELAEGSRLLEAYRPKSGR